MTLDSRQSDYLLGNSDAEHEEPHGLLYQPEGPLPNIRESSLFDLRRFAAIYEFKRRKFPN
jgi:hypothetical protein